MVKVSFCVFRAGPSCGTTVCTLPKCFLNITAWLRTGCVIVVEDIGKRPDPALSHANAHSGQKAWPQFFRRTTLGIALTMHRSRAVWRTLATSDQAAPAGSDSFRSLPG
jgi:hypothetical protein